MSLLRNMLELLYFASAPALVVVGLIGLRQLKISKDNARIDAKRRSLALASEQCAYYLTHIIPLIDCLNRLIKVSGLKFFEVLAVEVKGSELHAANPTSKEDLAKEMDKLNAAKEVQHALIDAYNALEGFAIYFTSGTADESVAFSSVGHTYCSSVRDYLPDLYICTRTGQHLQNLMKLFFLWNERIRAESLTRSRESIEKELASLGCQPIKPVGTE